LFSDPYVCTIVITHAIYSINIVYTNVDLVTDVNRDDWSNSHGIGVMEFSLKLSVTEIPSMNKIE
jgi:hypothetical protein